MHVQVDFRIAFAEGLHDRRQHIARLGVRRGDRQGSPGILVEISGHCLQAFNLGQRAGGEFQDPHAFRRYPGKGPPLPHEQVKSELLFQGLECAADRRLRRAQRGGRLGDRQTVAGDCNRVLKLVEVHLTGVAD